jgi:hypothetical protein
MRTHQAQQFARYHEAVQADRYTLTCIKMTPTSGWPGSSAPEGVAAADVYGRMGALIAAHSKRENIYYTPRSDAMHHILVDDLTRASLTRMLADGHKPAAVLESSPDRFQAVLNVPKTGETRTPSERWPTRSVRAEQSVWRPESERCNPPAPSARLLNHKWEEGAPAPKYQREDGTFPRSIWSSPCPAPAPGAGAGPGDRPAARGGRPPGWRARQSPNAHRHTAQRGLRAPTTGTSWPGGGATSRTCPSWTP